MISERNDCIEVGMYLGDMTICVSQSSYPLMKSEGYSFGLFLPSVTLFCPSGTISEYLLVRFDAYLV